MIDTPEKIRVTALVTEPAKPGEPKEVRIALSVCGCYKNERLTLVTERARKVASLLKITVEQLECYAVTAMLTRRPEVVACYKQRDLAEQKLAQIVTHTPFIARACHSFKLLTDE
jgi:hypothetical protein